MPMQAKKMEFGTITAEYDYKIGALVVQAKEDDQAYGRGGVEQKGTIVLGSHGIAELREALESIGQQVPTGRKFPH